MIPIQFALRRRMMGAGITRPDENTLLLLHGEKLVDASRYEVPLTNQNVVVSSAQSKFGGASLYFNGSSRILYPGIATNLSSGNWTVDWWEYPTSSSSEARFCTEYTAGDYGGILLGYNGTLLYISNALNNWSVVSGASAFTVTPNTWTHWAIVRNGNTLSTYRNGTLYWTTSISGNIYHSNGTFMGAIGDYRSGDPSQFIGYIDEFRVSNVARWTGNFTPPTKPYSNY